MYTTTYFARSNFRNQKKLVGINLLDRFHHVYGCGQTGTGKTTLIKTKLLEDIRKEHAVCFIDPHGDAIQEIYEQIHPRRRKDIIYLDFSNPKLEWGYNPLRKVSYQKRSLVTGSILDILRQEWKSAWGMKMESILRFTILTLLDQPKANFGDINRLLLDEAYRKSCLEHIQNPYVKVFWIKEFPKLKNSDLQPVLSKTGSALSHPILRKLLIENTRQISLRYAMDNRKILLINLARGAVGSDVSNIIGSLLLNSLVAAAFSRIDTEQRYRNPFFIYIDEFQNISNPNLLSMMLSELRKFNVGCIFFNQFLYQLDAEVRNSILGNVGTLITFRTGVQDAKIFAQEFYPVFKTAHFTSLKRGSIYLRLLINGQPSKPFSADVIKS